MNEWFDERYIKETPIEEQIRGQVRAECHYMDKADIYEWITQNQIKIMDLQSKIDKAIEFINSQKKTISKSQADLFNEDRDNKSKLQVGTFMWNVDELLSILKEDK